MQNDLSYFFYLGVPVKKKNNSEQNKIIQEETLIKIKQNKMI